MADVFISYAREDRAFAQLMAQELASAGFSVWWDRELIVGQDFDAVIEQELDRASCVIVCWSKASRDSRYVRDEARRADKRNVLAPVQIDSAELPLGFGTLHTENLAGWQGDLAAEPWQRLILQVEALANKKAQRRSDGAQGVTGVEPGAETPVAGGGGAGIAVAQSGSFALLALAALAAGWLFGSGQQIGIMGTAVVLALMVFWLMQRADQDLHPHLKALATRWLLPVKGQARVNTPEAFLRLFEAVFGPKHLSWKCFWRSVVASSVGLAVMLVVFDALEPGASLWKDVKAKPGILIGILFLTSVPNIAGDYVSLGETRLLLRSASRRPAWLPIFIVLDFILTFAIFWVGFVMIASIFDVIVGGVLTLLSIEKILNITFLIIERCSLGLIDSVEVQYEPQHGIVMGSMFATAYLTSVWLWLTVLISPIARLLLWSRTSGLSTLGRLIDVARKPFTALGYVMAMIVLGIGTLIWSATLMFA